MYYTGGKEAFTGEDSNDSFLDKFDILEYGLQDDFVERYNLSVLVHHLFMPKLDVSMCRKGLNEYIKMFRQPLKEAFAVSSGNKGILWRTVLQLVCVIMALQEREEGENIANLHPPDIIEEAWSADGEEQSQCPAARIQNAVVSLLNDIASRAAKDSLRLYGLYQNTLLLLLPQLRIRFQSLEEPSDKKLVQGLLDLRAKEMPTSSDYNSDELKELDVHWFMKGPAQELDNHKGRDDDQYGKEPTLLSQSQSHHLQQSSSSVPDLSNNGQNGHDAHREVEVEQSVESTVQGLENNRTDREYDYTYKTQGSSEIPHQSNNVASAKETYILIESDDENDESNTAALPINREDTDDALLLKSQSNVSKEDEQPTEEAVRISNWLRDLPGYVNGFLEEEASVLEASNTSNEPGKSSIVKVDKGKGRKLSSDRSSNDNTTWYSIGEGDFFESDTVMHSSTSKQEETAPKKIRRSRSSSTSSSLSLLPRSPMRSSTKVSKPQHIIDRVARAAGMSSVRHRLDSDSEFEDDGDDLSYIKMRKPATVTSSSTTSLLPVSNGSLHNQERLNNNAKPNNKHVLSGVSWSPSPVRDENDDTNGNKSAHSRAEIDAVQRLQNRQQQHSPLLDNTTAATAQGTSNKKARRENRHWTQQEVDRLLELVPMFQHDPHISKGIVGRRPRTIKWSQLKRYDKLHGNILQHRTEVMLKDKYREKTDNGAHRGRVNELLQTKSHATPKHKFPSPDRRIL
ncbi:hypothetical protein BCR41DRAFT_8025 [Lobosporangium transversale]|uniref:Uncharacterized protein n=1 Tax=Lobosporangium transversale TaxID=64571 RepID=A0A1Y2H780_9FUNG|nr:hypothetical protein BCR41DRAFT_8025 [Lobosporangium transversale]ORZ28902.1 hypothetical protein BCR41DRAFT_8025 [Lobosporangium transversale]|eukprot:XP_021886575.1 hypothetical protein BCR41DRAFT_8025 [Lobosporangium transversale]